MTQTDRRDTSWMPPDLSRAQQLALWQASGDGIDKAFWEFHHANPEIYELLVRYARQAVAAGRGRFGVRMIWERLRWYVLVETQDPTGIKLNDHYHSRYARLIMLREPDLSGLFETRLLKTSSRLAEVRLMPPRQSMLDSVATDLAIWLDQESGRIAAAMAPQGISPFAAPVSEEQKLQYYRDQLFNPDGSPNLDGRNQQMQRLGPQGFTQVYKAVLKAYPSLRVPTPPGMAGGQAMMATPPMPPSGVPNPGLPRGIQTPPMPQVTPIIPHMAQGGIVNQPTMALIGEAGPEAVVPLTGLTSQDTRAQILRNAGWTEDAIAKASAVPTTISNEDNPVAVADFRKNALGRPSTPWGNYPWEQPQITMYRPAMEADAGSINPVGTYIAPASVYEHEAHHAIDAATPTVNAALQPQGNRLAPMSSTVVDDLNTLRQYAATQHNAALYDAANAAMSATGSDPDHINHYLANVASISGAPDWYLARYFPYLRQTPQWGGAQAQSAQLAPNSSRLQAQDALSLEQYQRQVAAGQVQPR